MMDVKTKKEHHNGYGDKYVKEKGDVYSVPEAAGKTLIDQGFVEEVPEKQTAKEPAKPAAKAPAKKPSGDGE